MYFFSAYEMYSRGTLSLNARLQSMVLTMESSSWMGYPNA